MLISYNWLKEYIDIDLSPSELSDKLTLAGLEVECLEETDDGDSSLEVNITPNRPDCLSLIGIAREVSALSNSSVKYPEDKVLEAGKDINDLTSVVINDARLCPRYSARVIEGVKVGPSPKWLVDKLNAVGLRPINNIVDITNYVLFEYGHPLHAFDYDLLKENRIIIRQGKDSESFTALDNTKCNIRNEMLVIADAERPVALAGVIGGQNTEVSEKTINVLLESAYFEPTQIRRTSKKLGVQTDSSYRFERGADPDAVLKSSNRATRLILELAGGKASKGIIDIYPTPLEYRNVVLRIERVNSLLGTDIPDDMIKGYLEKLGFSIAAGKENCHDVKIPSFRRDITREIDLIEEIARLHGYDNIESKNPGGRINNVNLNKYSAFIKDARTYLQGNGFCEAINYSFISDEMQKLFQNAGKDNENIAIRNPISMEWGVMRNSLIPGLLNSLQKNFNKGITDIQLFELGRQYFYAENKTGLSKETNYLAGVANTKIEKKLWSDGAKGRDIYYLKGIVEMLLENLRVKGCSFKTSSMTAFSNLIELYANERKIGIIGELHKDIPDKLDIKDKLLTFEINLDLLYDLKEKNIVFKPISRYPGLLRDLAVFANREIKSKDIEDFIRQEGSDLLKETTLFDCYEGKPIPDGKKSLAYSLVFRDDERTLKDEEVDLICDNIIDGLARKFDARLRPQ